MELSPKMVVKDIAGLRVGVTLNNKNLLDTVSNQRTRSEMEVEHCRVLF